MRNEQEVERVINLYSDMVRKLCFINLKNYADCEDIFQIVFMKYVLHSDSFESEKHLKAWLAKVTINACKDLLKSYYKKKVTISEVLDETLIDTSQEKREIMECVLELPKKYKEIIYLHYYEGYNAREIGEILNKKENTVYTLLARGRKILKDKLGGGDDE